MGSKSGIGSYIPLRGRSGQTVKAWRGKEGYKEAQVLKKKYTKLSNDYDRVSSYRSNIYGKSITKKKVLEGIQNQKIKVSKQINALKKSQIKDATTQSKTAIKHFKGGRVGLLQGGIPKLVTRGWK